MKDDNKEKIFTKNFFLKDSFLFILALCLTLFVGYLVLFNNELLDKILEIGGAGIVVIFVTLIVFGIFTEIRDNFF